MGEKVSARADVFSFGVMLYEMVAGRKAFEGTSQASLIAAIIHKEPARLSTVQPVTPEPLEHLVRHCLEKDPDARWQSASDILSELKWIVDTGTGAGQARIEAPRDVPLWRRRVPAVYAVAVAGLAALGGAAAAWIAHPAAPQTHGPISRLTVALPPGDQVLDVEAPSLAMSPDGSALAYTAVGSGGKQQLFLRRLNTAQSQPVDSTEGAREPFFSMDGNWIGFFAQNKLKKVSVATGTVQTICDAPSGRGGAWGPGNAIYFSPSGISGVWKVSASGGTSTEVTHLDRAKGEVSHRWPQVLPGGTTILFTVWTGPGLDEKLIESQVLATGERHVLVQGADTGRYVTTGHLVYARADQLLSMEMDVGRLAVSGTPIPLEEHVRMGSEGAQYAVSDNGEVAYLPGSSARYERRIVWVDRKGTIERLPLPTRDYTSVALSPDGREAAIEMRGSYRTIWIYDFLRSTMTPLTPSTASSQSPVWTPDGSRVVYRGTRAGFRNLFWKQADGTGDEERLTTKEDVNQAPGTLSPDGKWMAFDEIGARGGDLWMLPLSGDRKPQAFLATQANEQNPRFSPDGRWIAYVSDGGGRQDVYVQEFSGSGAKRLVSTDGGTEPIWARDGRELFYLNGDRLMAVTLETKPSVSLGSPRAIVEGAYVRSATNASAYDVSLDGQRFLRVQPTEPEPPTNQIAIVLNWSEELREHTTSR
jgi:serine/threonine-protein kinase